MEQPKNKLLQICGILMIIGGSLGIILSIVAVIAALALVALVGGTAIYVLIAAIIAIVSSIVSLIAGVTGVKNAAVPANAGKCITIGMINIALSLLGNVIGVIGGNSFFSISTFTGLVLPALYLVGAYQNKNQASSQ